MTSALNYRKTLIACYLGFITQAISANFAPLLFLMFHKSYGIPLGRIALISFALFFTQLVVDIICTKLTDRIGYRASVIGSEALSAFGLIGLAILPEIMDPFTGMMISVCIYAIGSGLIEVVVSPIVEACPFDNKESVMSLLHSFYCWGCVGVIAISTVFFGIFGMGSWKLLAFLWALIPIVNIYNFATCPIEKLVEDGKGMKLRELFRNPVFFLGIVLMVCAGASELSMAQWASAFAESALGISKTAGDLAGPCLFAVTMGLCRSLYGKFGDRIELTGFMLASAAMCLVCYLMASISPVPMIRLAGCILCGFSVGIMWPGTISIMSKRLPSGGTALFAMLAMAGDLGGASGPGLVGFIAGRSGDDIGRGLFAGIAFPVMMILSILIIRHKAASLPKDT